MLSKLSVKKPYTVLVAVVLVIILGVVSFSRLTTDLLPSMNFPYLVVMTTYPGASPETVETTVTATLEGVAAGTNNIKSLSSVSYENYSLIICEYNDGTNMDSVMLEMRESLDQVKGYFPDEVGSPVMIQINPDMLPVLTLAVDSASMTAAELALYIDNELISDLESVEGVATVSASGQIVESIQVILRQEKIAELNEKIVAALDEKFADAEAAISDAESQLEDGQNALTDGKNQLTTTIPGAQSQLNSAQFELAEKKGQLETALAELLEQEKLLLSSQSMLETTKATLLSLKAQLEDMQDQVEDTEDSDASADPTLPDEVKDALGMMDQELLAEIQAALVALGMGNTNNVEDMKLFIETSLETIDQGLKSVEEGAVQIAVGKEQINSALTQIEAGKTEISSQLTALSIAQIEAMNKLTEGTIAMTLGQAELTNQKDVFEETKNTAYENVNLNKMITLDTISGLLMAQNFSMPAGYITEDGIQYLIRVGEKLESVEDLEGMILFDLGMEGIEPITLRDVAEVVVTDNSHEVYAKVNGAPAVILSVEKQSSYSTAEVSKSALAKLDQVVEENSDLSYTVLMDQGIYINLIIDSVLSNLLSGGILAILVLWLFLKDFRPTLIIACSIPISILTAIVLMYFTGITLNMISLSGLALGVGMLVDNSIVVIENIYRLRQKGKSLLEAAIEGARGVGLAIVASTLTTVVVFLPIVFIEGMTRQLFVDLALTIGFSLFASLIVALTLVPVMASKVLTKEEVTKQPLFDKIKSGYGKSIVWSLNHKWIVLGATLVLLVVSIVAAFSRGTAFIPDMNSNQVTVTVTMPEGAQMAETGEMADEVSDRILAIAGVDSVGATIGSGSLLSSGSSESATLYVIMKEDFKGKIGEVSKEIEDRTNDLKCTISTNSASMDLSALSGSGLSIEIKGKDLETLENLAKDMAEKLQEVEGLEEISDGIEETTPEVNIVVDKEKAAEYGLTVAQVFQQVMAALAADSASGKLSTVTQDYDIYLIDEEKNEADRQTIYDLMLTGTKDQAEVEVALEEVAAIAEEEGLASITRSNQQRILTVSAGVSEDYNISIVSEEVQKLIDEVEIPNGYTMKITGENETINQAMNDLYLMLLLAVVFMYLLMVAQFQSLLSPFIILFTVPLAFTGGFLALFIGNREVSIIGMLGFVVLAGVIVNNGIVLVDYVNQLMEEGMEKKAALVEAGVTRLRPIIMTALTTILGLSMMVFSTGMGADMTRDLALVTIGGMIYGTLLTLVVVPCMYDLLRRKNYVKKTAA